MIQTLLKKETEEMKSQLVAQHLTSGSPKLISNLCDKNHDEPNQVNDIDICVYNIKVLYNRAAYTLYIKAYIKYKNKDKQ